MTDDVNVFTSVASDIALKLLHITFYNCLSEGVRNRLLVIFIRLKLFLISNNWPASDASTSPDNRQSISTTDVVLRLRDQRRLVAEAKWRTKLNSAADRGYS